MNQVAMTTNKKTRYLVMVAVLSVLSFLLMMLEFPIPFMPPWMKLDLSEIPAIFGAFSLGPVAGVMIELVKNILHLLFKNNDGTFVGELASFVCGCALVVPAAIIYRRKETKKAMMVSLIVGSVCMVVFAALMNYFVLLPVYSKIFMPMDKLVSLAGGVNPLVTSVGMLILVGVVPFNIVKCAVLSLITYLLYDRLKPYLRR